MASFGWNKVLVDQHEFSLKTFGPDFRPDGISDHIQKELVEIEADPYDIEEWIDVAILAFDGAMRSLKDKYDHSPETVAAIVYAAYVAKQNKNFAREWPDWRTADLSKAIEHVRGHSD